MANILNVFDATRCSLTQPYQQSLQHHFSHLASSLWSDSSSPSGMPNIPRSGMAWHVVCLRMGLLISPWLPKPPLPGAQATITHLTEVRMFGKVDRSSSLAGTPPSLGPIRRDVGSYVKFDWCLLLTPWDLIPVTNVALGKVTQHWEIIHYVYSTVSTGALCCLDMPISLVMLVPP